MINRESNICNSYKICNFGGDIFVRNCCQPPCEAVSWNVEGKFVHEDPDNVSLLARLWVETFPESSGLCQGFVSLLARLWVETYIAVDQCFFLVSSASLRGCELKHDGIQSSRSASRSASLRGWELKFLHRRCTYVRGRQPPCEAVNWNMRYGSGWAVPT